MNGMIQALCDVTEHAEMAKFLDELLTDREREALSLRWELMRQLKEGKTQRAIAENLHVSLCKVTRGNRILKNENSISKQLLEKEQINE